MNEKTNIKLMTASGESAEFTLDGLARAAAEIEAQVRTPQSVIDALPLDAALKEKIIAATEANPGIMKPVLSLAEMTALPLWRDLWKRIQGIKANHCQQWKHEEKPRGMIQRQEAVLFIEELEKTVSQPVENFRLARGADMPLCGEIGVNVTWNNAKGEVIFSEIDA